MKAKLFILSTLLVLLFTADFSNAKRRGVSDYFYTNLTSHGKWIEMNDGLVVWRPYDSFGRWSPYAHGKWIWSNHGWYWDSYEVYGHIVYHYGRWHFDDYYGWIWVPDYEWAPAWVEWRYDNDYIGWAPLPPYAMYNMNYGVRYSRTYVIGVGWWKFVAIKHFNSSNVYGHYVSKKYRDRIYRGTNSQLDYGYERDRIMNRSIDPRIVERASNTKIRETEIIRSGTVGTDREPIVRNNDRIEIRQPLDVRTADSRDLKIEKSSRKTNLDASTIQIGRTVETRQTVKEDSKSTRETVNADRTTAQTRTNVTEEKPKVVERKTETRTSTPAVRETVKQNIPERTEQRKTEVTREVRNTEVKSEVRSEVPIKQTTPTPKREEVRTVAPAPQTETRNIERNTDVRRNESNISRTSSESKPETRTSTSTTDRSSSREKSNSETTTTRRR
jgi:hypothetical protein